MCVRLTISASVEMTLPSVVRDLLMFAPSCNLDNKHLFIYSSKCLKILLLLLLNSYVQSVSL